MSSSTIEQIQQQLNDLQAQISKLESPEQTSAPTEEAVEENAAMSEEEMMAAMMADGGMEEPASEEAPAPVETSAEMLEVAGDFNPQASIDYTNEKRNSSDVNYSEETIAFFQHEDTLQRIMHAVKDGIMLIDQHGVIRGFSKGAEEIFGYKEEDVIDTRAQKLFPHDEREKFKRFFAKLNEEAKAAVAESVDLPDATTELDAKHFLHSDMRRVKLDMHATSFEDGFFYICLAQDMREKLKHQERMQERSNLAQLLKSVARSLNNAETIEQAIGETLEHLGQQLRFDLGHAYIYNAQENKFKSHDHWVAPQGGQFALFKNTTGQTTFNETEGLIGVTFQYAEPQNFEYLDETLNDNRLTAMKSTGFKQAITVPVLVKDVPVAVIELYLRDNIEVDEHMIDILHNIGYQVGHTLRRLEVEHRLSGTTEEEHLDSVIATAAASEPEAEVTEEVVLDETTEATPEDMMMTEDTPTEETATEQVPEMNMGVADMAEETTEASPEDMMMAEDAPTEETATEAEATTEETSTELPEVEFEEPEDTTLSDISFDDDEPVVEAPEAIEEEEEPQDLSPLQKLALESNEAKYDYTNEGNAVRKEESALDMEIHGVTDVEPETTEPEIATEEAIEEPTAEAAADPLAALVEVAQEQTEPTEATEEETDESISEEDRKIAEQMMQMG